MTTVERLANPTGGYPIGAGLLLRRHAGLFGLAFALALGCGGGTEPGEDVVDGDGVPDTLVDGTPEVGDILSDDGTLPEGAVDRDGDTYPEGIDCDDDDPDVIPGSTRPCTSTCGTGVERCEAGAWVGCTAPSDCACTEPGRTRVVDCGSCGIASQRCGSDGFWELPGPCMEEGECPAGEMQTEPCGLCGTRSRICDATCAWRPWTECAERGTCARGATRVIRAGCPEGEIRPQACSDECEWADDGVCTNDCMLAPRTEGSEEEICIPGGLFIMGSEETHLDYLNRMPVHEVVVSPYLIDKYVVTNARYRRCVLAGGCAAPRDTDATYFRADMVRYNWYPVTHFNYEDAETFCAWDGGRALPTEAEWEKAARGPAPRQVRYPWGDDANYCDYVNHQTCGATGFVAANAYPANASYYGVVGMMGGILELTQDRYSATYYAVSPRLDPTGPPAGADSAVRSFDYWHRLESGGLFPPLTRRGAGGRSVIAIPAGFRCVHRPWTE